MQARCSDKDPCPYVLKQRDFLIFRNRQEQFALITYANLMLEVYQSDFSLLERKK